jgi:hypothetical protein
MKGIAMRTITRFLAVAFCILASAPAYARDCKDGQRMTVSGSVERLRVGDQVFIDATASSPCNVDIVDFPRSKLPRSCIEGARFSATGQIDTLFQVFLHAETITCR